MNELAKVNRFEVIDHRENGEGRVMVARGNNIKVEIGLSRYLSQTRKILFQLIVQKLISYTLMAFYGNPLRTALTRN